ncbi:MAG: type III secretion system chaperone [Alphaproteobacteria bacterium]
MSAELWNQFMDEVASSGGFSTEDQEQENDLPLLLYTKPREGDDDDIAYIALDENVDEIVTNVCLDYADSENSSVLLDLLEQNSYVFHENDAVFSLTPDGSAVTVSVRHPLRLQHAPEWLTWLENFMDSCHAWNENLKRISEFAHQYPETTEPSASVEEAPGIKA